MEPKYDGEYLHICFEAKGEQIPGLGRRRIGKSTFKTMLSNRPGWIKGSYLNVKGQSVPYMIRRFER